VNVSAWTLETIRSAGHLGDGVLNGHDLAPCSVPFDEEEKWAGGHEIRPKLIRLKNPRFSSEKHRFRKKRLAIV